MPVHLKPLPLVFQVRCLSTKISAEAHSATLARVFSGRFFARSSRDKKRAKRGCFANCWAIKGEALARHIVPMAKKMKPGISGTARPMKPKIMHKLPITPREIRAIIVRAIGC